jgi:NADH-quinone oxidoreductase subunit L
LSRASTSTARLLPVFEIADGMLIIVAIVGLITALMTGLIALAQTDIKKVLAYSTVGQLGFMFIALGAGHPDVAMFHLMTHAFFKALLFLGSGSVIHATHHNQEMNKLGGLWKKMPITGTTFFIGSLALAGLPPLAGFWSKDEIWVYATDEYGAWMPRSSSESPPSQRPSTRPGSSFAPSWGSRRTRTCTTTRTSPAWR